MKDYLVHDFVKEYENCTMKFWIFEYPMDIGLDAPVDFVASLEESTQFEPYLYAWDQLIDNYYCIVAQILEEKS